MKKNPANRYRDLRVPAKKAYPGEEQAFQKDVAQWLKKQLYLRGLPQVFYHCANERKASIQQMARLKAQGVLPGVSDVVLPIRIEGYSGIYCELKSRKGSPGKEQKDFLNAVADEGFLAVVINDMETFMKVFTFYLDQRKTIPDEEPTARNTTRGNGPRTRQKSSGHSCSTHC